MDPGFDDPVRTGAITPYRKHHCEQSPTVISQFPRQVPAMVDNLSPAALTILLRVTGGSMFIEKYRAAACPRVVAGEQS